MWKFLVRLILRNRLANLIIIALLTAYMGWEGNKVQTSYEFANMLPESDTSSRIYQRFKHTFGQDGAVMFVGVQDERLFELEHFKAWHKLTEKVRALEGVQEVISVARMFHLVRNDSLRKFEFKQVMDQLPNSQQELDSLRQIIQNLKFYEGLLFNSATNVSVMMITLDNHVLNSKGRISLVYAIKSVLDDFTDRFGIELRYSGLPYIRTITSQKIQHELRLFVFLSLVISAIILISFFRSARTVLFIILVVLITLAFMFGMLQLFGYKITILTGILPPILIVIGVENSIFLLNKFYNEYFQHGNKIRALSRTIQRIGAANLLTNATTAAGFAAFIVTGNKMLVEFGIVASLNIMVSYVVSLMMIPIIFSYLPDPQPKQYAHFEGGRVNNILRFIEKVVHYHRNTVYVVTALLLLVGIFGLTKLRTTGNVVDDISHKEQMYKDLMFFEEHFNGVMPYEISIDTKKPKGVLRASTLQKIDRLQDTLALYPQFSKPLSVAELVKFSKQAFFRGDPAYYEMPNNQERNFILGYLPEFSGQKRTILNSFVDTALQSTRVSVQLANVSTRQIDSIQQSLQPKIDSIFPVDDYTVTTTGTSIIFLKGTNYLVKNLLSSLLLALFIIALIMALTFSSFKMIVVSLIPNLIPQLLTAAMMGYLGISIKPSTILIFSIALGISVDNTIHFLSRYRQQLKLNGWKIPQAVMAALYETGFSMIYSAVVLFCGFAIFILSSFGGTQALGYLVSFTLITAMLSNLFVLPSLLMTLDRWSTTRAFKEPLLEILDQEADLDLEQLNIEANLNNTEPSKEQNP
jgi:predicted RND superfamily exporter protein